VRRSALPPPGLDVTCEDCEEAEEPPPLDGCSNTGLTIDWALQLYEDGSPSHNATGTGDWNGFTWTVSYDSPSAIEVVSISYPAPDPPVIRWKLPGLVVGEVDVELPTVTDVCIRGGDADVEIVDPMIVGFVEGVLTYTS